MKIQPEHYQHIKQAIQTLVEEKGKVVQAHKEALKKDPRVKDLHKRFCFDLYHTAGLTSYSCTTLYDYLNDTHIYTALKKVVKELGI